MMILEPKPATPEPAGRTVKRLRVCAAYDASACAEAAVIHAIAFAARFGEGLTLVAIHDEADAAMHAGKGSLKEIEERCSRHSLPLRVVRKSGPPPQVLTSVLRRLQPDIVFLGGFGEKSQERRGLGSTAEQVLKALSCPAVVVGPGAIAREPVLERVKLVCAVDFPEDVDDRLKIIGNISLALDATANLVFAVDVCHDFSRPHSAVDLQYEFDRLADRLREKRVRVRAKLLYGQPEVALAKEAELSKADFILFGLHAFEGGSSYFKESLVARTIKLAPCPVLVFAQHASPQVSVMETGRAVAMSPAGAGRGL